MFEAVSVCPAKGKNRPPQTAAATRARVTQKGGASPALQGGRVFQELGQDRKILKSDGWRDAKFVCDQGIAVEPEGLEAEAGGAGNIPII